MSAAIYMPAAADIAAAMKSLDAAESVRKLKANLEANQAAIMQEAIKNWPQFHYNPAIDAPPVPQYEYRLSSYPELTAKPTIRACLPFEGKATVRVGSPLEKPEPLSYKAFCEIIAAVVKAEAPAVKVITDCNQNYNIVWLECNGVRREQKFALDQDPGPRPQDVIAAVVKAKCIEIRVELGKKAVGHAAR